MHPQIEDWPLMASMSTPILISILYVIGLHLLSTVFMKNRDDLTGLANVIMSFNIVFVAVSNVALFAFFLYMTFQLDYALLCEPPSKVLVVKEEGYLKWLPSLSWSDSNEDFEMEIQVAKGLWVYFILKIVEFVDHFIVVLRKDEVEMADVAHHIVMVIVSWFGLRSAPGGSTIYWAMFNCAFLAIASTYQSLKRVYMVPENPNSEQFWDSMKSVMLVIKNIQFVLTALHCVTTVYSGCGYPRHYALALLSFVVTVGLMSRLKRDFGGGGGGSGSGGGRRTGRSLKRDRGDMSRSEADDGDDLDEPRNDSPVRPVAPNSDNPSNEASTPTDGGNNDSAPSPTFRGCQSLPRYQQKSYRYSPRVVVERPSSNDYGYGGVQYQW